MNTNQRRLWWKCSVAPVVILVLSAGAIRAQDASDFLKPPVRGGSTEVQSENVEAKTYKGVEDVVQGGSPTDNANHARQELEELGGGAMPFEAESGGIGVMATGMGYYRTSSPNPDVVRYSRRSAYTKAFFAAKKELTKFLNGLSQDAKQKIVSLDTTSIDDERTALESLEVTTEKIEEAFSGMLSGVSLFEVHDDGKGAVTVSAYVTPKSRRKARTLKGGPVAAATIMAGLQQVLDEIKNGIVPPVGSKVIHVDATREIAFVGFGSSMIPSTKSAKMKASQTRAARLKAGMRARRALGAAMRNEQVSGDTKMVGAEKDHEKEYTSFVEADETAEESEEAKKAKEEIAAYSNNEAVLDQGQSIIKGKLPPGVTLKIYRQKDGWILAVAVYMGTLSKAAVTLAKPGDKKIKVRDGGIIYGPGKAQQGGQVGGDPRKKKKKKTKKKYW